MKNLSNIEHELDIVTKQYVDNAADTKVDKIEGKQLSTNDFTTEEKEKLAGLSIIQYSTLPEANFSTFGDIVQYVGATNSNYTKGHFYHCANYNNELKWYPIEVQDIPDTDWSKLNNYSTNLVSAKAITDDVEEGMYQIKVDQLPNGEELGGLPLTTQYEEGTATIISPYTKLFTESIVGSANLSIADRTAISTLGLEFYITYNGIKKKITLPKLNAVLTFPNTQIFLQQAISDAFGVEIFKIAKSGFGKLVFTVFYDQDGGYTDGEDWNHGFPTIVINSGDSDKDALPYLHFTDNMAFGFNYNLPISELLDTSLFVDGVYTINPSTNFADLSGNITSGDAQTLTFTETTTIGEVFNAINTNPFLDMTIYYEQINNRIMIKTNHTAHGRAINLGDHWELWEALNITLKQYSDNLENYNLAGGVIKNGIDGKFTLTTPSGDVYKDITLRNRHCVYRGIEFDFSGANIGETYFIGITKQPVASQNYNDFENKPTLNGITIEGNKVGADYGINDTNVYYGTEEPTTENVVMWVDPSGAPVSVLTTDNTTEYTPTEDYNPATKKYVDEHSINTDEIYGMDNYELLILNQEDISEAIGVDVHGQISSSGFATSGKTEFTGNIIGKSNAENLQFSISSTNEFIVSNSSQIQYTKIFGMNSSGQVESLAGINNALSQSEYVSTDALRIRANTTSETYFTWDFEEACKPTLNYKMKVTESSAFSTIIEILGSNDKTEWTSLLYWVSVTTSTTSDFDGPYIPTTAYRYFRIRIKHTITGSVSSSVNSTLDIYYLYFSNVPDVITKFKNNFISKNNFEIKETANVIIPSIPNYEYVTEENINGLPISFKLKENSDYKLRYDGETFITDGAKVITGTFTSSSSLQTIDLGFSPDLVICYVADNNTKGVGGSSTNTARYYTIPRILTKAYFHADVNNNTNGQIVDGGFSYMDSATGATVYYIAIRF